MENRDDRERNNWEMIKRWEKKNDTDNKGTDDKERFDREMMKTW